MRTKRLPLLAAIVLVLAARHLSFAQDEPPPEMLAFEEVPTVVGATQWLQRVSEVPASVTVVTAEEIKRFGYLTVADALRSVAGVLVTDDGQYPAVALRGFSLTGDFTTRVLILLDGHTMNERAGWSGKDFGLDQSVDVIERIEVIQGPGSVIYGTNAFFGVVNIVTRRGGDLAGLAPSLTFGSLDRRQVGLVAGAATKSGAELLVEGTNSFLDGGSVSLPAFEGKSYANDEDVVEAFLKGNASGFELLAKISKREKQVGGAPYGAVFGSSDTFYRDAAAFLEGSYAVSLGHDHDVRLRAYYDRYRYDDFFDYTPDPLFRDVIDSDALGGEFQFATRTLSKNLLAAGVEALYDKVHQGAFEAGSQEEGVFVDRDMGVVKFYVQDRYQPAEKWGLWAAVQLNHNTRFDDAVIPRGAVIYDPFPSTTLKLVYTEGFRNASPYEAFFEDGITLIGNDDLNSERIRTLEAIWEQRMAGGLSSRVSVFGNDIRDLINQVPVEAEDGDDDDGLIAPGESTRLQYQNGGGLRTAGIETNLRWASPSGFLGLANLTVLSDDGEGLPNFPHVLANAGLSVPILGDKLYLSGRLNYIGPRASREAGIDLPEAVLLDLTLFSRRPVRNVEITLGVRNLLDEDMKTAVGSEFVPIAIPGEPRTFFGKALLRF